MKETPQELPLTVLIPCKNEAHHMRECIQSVLPVGGELLVADSGSEDETMQIAAEFGARIIEREYVNSADFKNWAMEYATRPWILIVDADERVSPELANEIRRTLASTPEHDGYRVSRLNHLFGDPLHHTGWASDWPLRLFRREVARYETRRVHADVIVDTGKVGQLKGALLHHPYVSYGHFLQKLDRYTTWSALDLCEAGKRAGILKIGLRPVGRFLRYYVLQRGFLDGRNGLIVSMLAAFSVFLKYAKLYSFQRERSRTGGVREARGVESAPAEGLEQGETV